jgi:hypothetical protein
MGFEWVQSRFSDPLSHPLFLYLYSNWSLGSLCSRIPQHPLPTPILKRSTNTTYAAKDTTFDFLIYLSLADKLGVVEPIVWDKNILVKDYLGEVSLPPDDGFMGEEGSALGFNDPGNWVS